MALSVRMIGGCIGFAIYYNIFKTHYTDNAYTTIAPAAITYGYVFDTATIYRIGKPHIRIRIRIPSLPTQSPPAPPTYPLDAAQHH